MTTMQVKQQIDAMSDEDRFLAAAYLEHLSNERERETSRRAFCQVFAP
jgi:hypothetical protein